MNIFVKHIKLQRKDPYKPIRKAMGFMKMFSSCSNPCERASESRHSWSTLPNPIDGNPNPSNFKILRLAQVDKLLVTMIEYPNCNNYEGRKILVLENITKKELRKLKTLDPHFCDSGKHISPVARFVPSEAGWKYAVKFCEILKQHKNENDS